MAFTDEEREQLAAMAIALREQDNAWTHEPIFMVQRHCRTYGFDPAYSDNPVFVTNDEFHEVTIDPAGDDPYTCPHCEEPLTKDAVDDECCQACDELFDVGDDLCLTKTAFQDTWENVQPFFTRAGAEEYLRINGHNLRGKEPPRIYVEGSTRNAEWRLIRKLLGEASIMANPQPDAVVSGGSE